MAVFTYIPSFEATENSQPRARRVQFGDGYEQRIRYGLNTNLKEWSLTFANRTDVERDQITAFLDARGGVEAFDWTAPVGGAGKFVCEQWQVTLRNCNNNTIQATFREVVDL
jgi:phage-related protein